MIASNTSITDRMSPALASRFKEALGEAVVRLLLCTGATVDVGLWFRDRRVWAVATDDRLILFADGPRPYLQVTLFTQLSTTFYSHMSGELVCVPDENLRVRSLPMSPANAWKFLMLIHGSAKPEAAPSIAPQQQEEIAIVAEIDDEV